jgi:outer membrane protein OmpA-like peptidoglycan-associated protein
MKKIVRPITPRISQTTSVYYQPQVMNSVEYPLMDTQGWMEITGDFVAEGGETFLTIGNFLSAANSGYTDDTLLLTYLLPGSYYYIDDVWLYCLDCDDDDYNDEPLTQTDTTYKVGATFVLNNIFFDTDKSTLLQQSYQELQYLIAVLESHPKMKIEISGHTDSQGSDLHNQQLSENRAKEVVAYLMENGIEEKRLKFKGYGKTKPIATNATEEGRQKNRRVEFKILDL